MLAFLKGFWGKWAEVIVKFSVIGLTVLAVLLGAKNAGRDAERVEQMKRQKKRVEKSNEVERRVRRVPDGDAVKRLRRDWKRK